MSNATVNNEIVLFHAGQSLVLQVAQWIRRHSQHSLRLVSAKTPVAIEMALSNAAVVIVDATSDGDLALDVLEIANERLGRQHVSVYTEKRRDDLEIQVRLRGSLLLAGPMSPAEWEGFFEPLVGAATRVTAKEPVASAGGN